MNKGKLPSLSAALAGIPAGVQRQGPWCGRRQLFVRFAAEAETATIYTADALKGELGRLQARSKYHSIAIMGRDVLAEDEFLVTAFKEKGALPVMLDHDGQRPDKLAGLVESLAMVQVSIDGREPQRTIECVCETMGVAASKGVAHALVLNPVAGASDGPLWRIVEQLHQASAATQVVVHPALESGSDDDRHWAQWLERAMSVHADVRIVPRWPATPAR